MRLNPDQGQSLNLVPYAARVVSTMNGVVNARLLERQAKLNILFKKISAVMLKNTFSIVSIDFLTARHLFLLAYPMYSNSKMLSELSDQQFTSILNSMESMLLSPEKSEELRFGTFQPYLYYVPINSSTSRTLNQQDQPPPAPSTGLNNSSN